MNKNAAMGFLAVLLIAVCIVLLIVALVTGETEYLLIESAILHFGIIFAIVVAFESSRRNG